MLDVLTIKLCLLSKPVADKPGSVVNGHLSCLHVTVQLHARYPNADRAGP